MTEPKFESPLFFLIAGEASGDVLGARLMVALKKQTNGKARFAGIGGERMVAEGLELFFPQAELSCMGIVEVLCHLPSLLSRIRQTVDEVKKRQPAALITIDSPDFCFRVAKKLNREVSQLPLIHYVAPSVWAWRSGRAKKIARFLTHLLALLPFEPPYFTKEGLACTFVGHSIVESGAGKGDAARFRAKHQIPDQAEVLVVLPGSRMGEIKRLLPIFLTTVEKLITHHSNLFIVIPTVPQVEAAVRQATADWPVPVKVTLGDEDKYDAFAAATAALACSGTISVELAMARLPTVIAYKANALTAAIFRRVSKIKYATLVNIMQDSMIMPEYLQENCTPEKLAAAVHELMSNPSSRQDQSDALESIAEWLGRGQFVPSDRAAEVVLDVCRKRNRL